MSLTTEGIQLRNPSRPVREFVELISSMRFAIALLSVICVASVIGTVVQQHQPAVNYVNQFGPFWADVFSRLGLTSVYSTPWFLVILAFLVISTSLCIARNTPKILQDLRTFKEHIRESALASFHHRAQGTLGLDPDTAVQRVGALLDQAGWKARAQVRGNGVMVAAKRGGANRLGYLAAHSAIVLICIGGLFDGDLIVRAQMALFGKTPFGGSGLIAQVAPEHRLGAGNPTFRANLFVPEGARAGTAVINLENGIVLQELPFDIELKKFSVDYYATGMPKLFASDIVIHDRDGSAHPAVVKVNEPVIHQGVAIYQSSFEDGGSHVTLRARPFGRAGASFDVRGEVGGSTVLDRSFAGGTPDPLEKLQLEFTGLRTINVENMAPTGRSGSTDVRSVDVVGTLSQHLGSGAKPAGDKTLRNIGPSVTYKLRDAAGQAREYNNYMLPVALDDTRVFLFGVRDTPDQAFRYLRVPADGDETPDDWLRLKAALARADLRAEAAARYARQATPTDRPELGEQLKLSAQRALSLFAGAEPAAADAPPAAGLQAIQRFLETSVPEADRARTTDVLLRILNGALFELLTLGRAQDGLSPRQPDAATQQFMAQSVLALADSFAYPSPLLFTLKDFQQVQASVFQVTRAPGKTLVYLGCMCLIVGVFTMLYVRERRLWIWITPAAGGSAVTMALSATRQTLDIDREFDGLKQALLGPPPLLEDPP